MGTFDILQWNCKGLSTHKEELKVLMSEHNPGIICLQETMQKASKIRREIKSRTINNIQVHG